MVIYVRIVAAEAREAGASDARNEGEADPPTIYFKVRTRNYTRISSLQPQAGGALHPVAIRMHAHVKEELLSD